jgi:Mrp family chromosome partitioning ATPase/LPS O-antigen subunit length determinant protein (WzzB/FepE family)
MEPTSRPPRYVTLRDYLRVLRRYAIPIILIAAIGAAAGLVDAKRQTPVYEATASVSFTDPAQDLSLVGLQSGLVQAPLQLAAQSAETLTRPQIMSRVKANLRTRESIQSLASRVSGATSTAGLLQISTTAASPTFAARLANSVAAIVVAQANRAAQHSFSTAADDIRHEIATLQSKRTAAKSTNSTQLPVLEDELARLDTLSHFAQSAQLAQSAQAPSSPSSPKTVRSAILGLILGLALAILLAFVRDSMDRRLRTTQEIEASFQFPIVGHVRKQAMGKVVQEEAAAKGKGDLRVDLEAFRILRRNIEFLNLDSPPRAIVVTSGVPEEGKTTVAASLAFATASAGKRTLLIDCDMRRPDLAKRLDIERSPGLSDYLTGEKASTEITQRIQLAQPPSPNGKEPAHSSSASDALALTVIPAGSPTSHAAELLGSRRFKQLMDQVVAAYDVVVLDSSPLLPVADTLEMLPAVQAVVLCARESKTKREEALAAKRALERFPRLPVGVVITGIKPARHDYEMYSYSYSYT